MRPRSFAFCAALVLMASACGSDTRSAGTARGTSTGSTRTAGAPASTAAGARPAAESATQAPQPSPNAPRLTPIEPGEPSFDQQQVPSTNPTTNPAEDALSTFAMDVDTGSYTHARGVLQAGGVPDPGTVRTEEFVNAHDQGYTPPADGDTFALTIDATTAPFLPADTRIVRVGIQGESIADEDRADANLTFVVDISGSMADPGKLDAVRPALAALVETLRPTDRVGIVVYSDDTRVLLESTPVSDRREIAGAIELLQPEGSTNVEQGLRLGYDQARAGLDSARINRVILLSDGVANVGETGPEEILRVIGDASRDGIDLVTVGFGLGEYNDMLMEQLADKGDGFYAYVDGEGEAVRLFGEDLTGTLQTIAREAKVQVEFNPATVASYRLVGFENRAVADKDFRDDSVDGGEVGAGHTVTALYEVGLRDGLGRQDAATVQGAIVQQIAVPEEAWIARGVIRWLDPDTSAPSERDASLSASAASGAIDDAPLRLRQDVYVAAFAESLRGSGWGREVSLSDVSEHLHSIAARLDDDTLAVTADLVDARIELR